MINLEIEVKVSDSEDPAKDMKEHEKPEEGEVESPIVHNRSQSNSPKRANRSLSRSRSRSRSNGQLNV